MWENKTKKLHPNQSLFNKNEPLWQNEERQGQIAQKTVKGTKKKQGC